MPVFNEPIRPCESLVSEAAGERSREAITVGATAITACMVLGATLGAATAAVKAGGNTGNGTFTIDASTPTLAGAKPGVYRLRCIAAAANGGTFRLEDPDGIVLGDTVMAAGAATVSEHIRGALADGSSDFIVGDGFDITVPATFTYPPNPNKDEGNDAPQLIESTASLTFERHHSLKAVVDQLAQADAQAQHGVFAQWGNVAGGIVQVVIPDARFNYASPNLGGGFITESGDMFIDALDKGICINFPYPA